MIVDKKGCRATQPASGSWQGRCLPPNKHCTQYCICNFPLHCCCLTSFYRQVPLELLKLTEQEHSRSHLAISKLPCQSTAPCIFLTTTTMHMESSNVVQLPLQLGTAGQYFSVFLRAFIQGVSASLPAFVTKGTKLILNGSWFLDVICALVATACDQGLTGGQ